MDYSSTGSIYGNTPVALALCRTTLVVLISYGNTLVALVPCRTPLVVLVAYQ